VAIQLYNTGTSPAAVAGTRRENGKWGGGGQRGKKSNHVKVIFSNYKVIVNVTFARSKYIW
jgi:hypothetical protein